MKRIMMSLLCLLCCAALIASAAADTWYIYTPNGKSLNIRDAATNEVVGHIPYGTAVEPDDDLSTEVSAFITYEDAAGYVKWIYLTREEPAPLTAATPEPTPEPTPVPTPSAEELDEDTWDGEAPAPAVTAEPAAPAADQPLTITAVGCTMQHLNAKGKPEGVPFTELDFARGYQNPLTGETHEAGKADVVVIGPNGKAPAYWVINGTRYDFNKVPSKIMLIDLTYPLTIEAVAKKAEPQTLLDPDAIRAARTREPLTLKTIDAKMCFLTDKGNGKGGWFTEQDFTGDYTNLATGRTDEGGMITVQVKADKKNSRSVEYWLFNETEFHLTPKSSSFIVRSEDESWVYQPMYGKKAAPTKAPAEVKKVRVTCSGCTFSGGGYSGARSGMVPVGTTIHLKANTRDKQQWTVNGAGKGLRDNTYTLTVKTNTSISAYPVVY